MRATENGTISENNCAEHGAKAVHGIFAKRFVGLASQVYLGVHFSHARNDELLGGLLGLLLDPLIVLLGQLGEALEGVDILSVLVRVGVHFETVGPVALVHVHKHLLLSLVFAVVDRDRVVVLIEAAHQGDCARVRQVANVGRRLSGFQAGHHHALLNAAEGVNYDLALHRLDGIHDNSHSSWVEVLLLLLSLDISA